MLPQSLHMLNYDDHNVEISANYVNRIGRTALTFFAHNLHLMTQNMGSDSEGDSASQLQFPSSDPDEQETHSTVDESESDDPLSIPSPPPAKPRTKLSITLKPTAKVSKLPRKPKSKGRAPAKKIKKPLTYDNDESETAQSWEKYLLNLNNNQLMLLLPEIVLLVPVAKSAAMQRITLMTDIPFSEAIDEIHKTIGCSAVPRKPELTYRLSTSAQKASPINLSNEDNWSGCLDDIIGLEKKKRANVSVNIIVLENVSL
jgi:hypothetical protein